MASEIRVDKINSLSGVGTVTLSPTGVDIAGITTAATLRATTGIVTSLTAGSLTSLGAVSGTTGTFTGDVDIADKIVHTGDTNTAIRFPAADTITLETAGSERFRILSDGKIGIGTDTPLNPLDVHGSSADILIYDTDAYSANSNGAAISLQGNDSAGNRKTLADVRGVANGANRGEFSISTRNTSGQLTEALRIDSSQNVGIGTDDPQEILHVKAASETVSSRDGVIFGSTDQLAADKGLPLVWAAHIGTDQDYGIASICGRKENATSDNGAGYLQFGTGSAAGAISEKLRIDSNGDLLYASSDRNYASWYKTPTNSSSNSATTSTEDLIFGTAVIANTDVYNTTNGRYTAPVDGLYHIRFNGLIDNNAAGAGMQVLMRKNGSTYGSQIAYQSISSKNDGIYNQMSGTGIMYMSAGDYATIYATSGMHTSNECNYIVYLIRGTN